MSGSPLVTVAGDLHIFSEPDVPGSRVVVESSEGHNRQPLVRVALESMEGSSDGYVAADRAPALAAAILAAAGLEHHRVIDLGGPLPRVIREGSQSRSGNTVVDGGADRDAWLLGKVRECLALLDDRTTTSRHDPAEFDAVLEVITQGRFLGAASREEASAILDALAKVRSQP